MSTNPNVAFDDVTLDEEEFITEDAIEELSNGKGDDEDDE